MLFRSIRIGIKQVFTPGDLSAPVHGVIFAERIEDVPRLLCDVVESGDVVITQGAGNVAALAQTLSQLDLSGGAPS